MKAIEATSRPTRRTLTLLLALVLASPLALPVLAQPAAGGPGGGFDAGLSPSRGPGARPFPLGHITRVLDLSDAQVEQARALLEEHIARIQPIHDETRTLGEELQGLLDGDAPDPSAVGSRVIRVHELKDETRAARQDFEAAFAALLTPEQAERWDLLKDIRLFLGR